MVLACDDNYNQPYNYSHQTFVDQYLEPRAHEDMQKERTTGYKHETHWNSLFEWMLHALLNNIQLRQPQKTVTALVGQWEA